MVCRTAFKSKVRTACLSLFLNGFVAASPSPLRRIHGSHGEIVDLRNGTGRDNTKHFDVLRVWDWRSAVSKLEEGGTVSTSGIA